MKASLIVLIAMALGIIPLSGNASEEKSIHLKCELSQDTKNRYVVSEKYKSCMANEGFEVGCLLYLTLVAEFTESFVVNKDVSSLWRGKDNRKEGSAYWWEYEALHMSRSFGHGATTFRVDRSDLSYLAIFQSKEGDEIVVGQGQCELLDKERKF